MNMKAILMVLSAFLLIFVFPSFLQTSSKSPLLILKGHTSQINSVAISPDGKTCLTASDDKTVKLWDMTSGKLLMSSGGTISGVTNVLFIKKGLKFLTGGYDGNVRVWDIQTGKEEYTYSGFFNDYENKNIQKIAVSPDEKTFLVLNRQSMVFRSVSFASGKLIKIYKGHFGNVNSIAFSNNGMAIISGSADHSALLWETSSGSIVKEFKGPESVANVQYFPDGKSFIMSCTGTYLILWNINSGEKIMSLQRYHSSGSGVFTANAFTPDGKYVLCGGGFAGNPILYLFDMGTGNYVARLTGHTKYVSAIAISHDGKKAVTGSYDGTAIIWDF